jgi:clan AA aspartic protease
MLTLSNPRLPDRPPVQVEALADTGSVHLCLPASVAEALGLEEQNRQTVTIADGTRRTVPYVGPVELRFGNRVGFGGALVMGHQVLLGALPLADMDLVVIPRDQRVVVNPNSPDQASSVVL